jgi:hypothetical protein
MKKKKKKKTTTKRDKRDEKGILIEPPLDLEQIVGGAHADINTALKCLGSAMQKLKILKKAVEEVNGEDEYASARGR